MILLSASRVRTVYEYDAFVQAINEEGPGKEVQLQIIHDGVRKNIKLMLGSFSDNSPEPEWNILISH